MSNNQRLAYTAPAFKRVPVNSWNTLAPRSMEGHLHESIDGIEIRSLTQKYGTPLFIISEQTLRDRFRAMQAVFRANYPDTIVAWSYKTNYLSAVCSIFRSEGAWAEVVSGFEYAIARDLGIPGNQIIFNGPYKTDEQLKKAVTEGAVVNVDSFEEIDQLKALAKELNRTIDIGVRVNVKLNYPPWSKFGFNYEERQAYEAVRLAEVGGHLKVRGFHIHAGTYITDTTIYSNAVNRILDLALDLEAETDFELKYLDTGGGYASPNTLHAQFLRGEAICPTYAQYADAICTPLRMKLPRFKGAPRLFIEPGRSVVDEGISLVTQVVSSKHQPDGSRAIIVDAGVNVLPTAYWYKHEMVVLKPGPLPEETVNVLGGLCMNIDVLRTNVKLPAVGKGDLILIRNVGAYNFSQSMQFIYTRPNYILVHDGKDSLVREQETGNYVRTPEHLPEHLRNEENSGSVLCRKPDGQDMQV